MGEPVVRAGSGVAQAWPYDPTGIPHLDEVIGGGIAQGSLLLVVGTPGSGKTTLALQMAFAAATAGRQVLVLTALSESTDKLVAHLRTYRFFNDQLIGDTIQILSLSQYLTEDLAGVIDTVIADVRRRHVSLVVLDGFKGLRGAAQDPQVVRQLLYDLSGRLSILRTTTIITSESTPRDASLFPEATTADILLGIHYHLEGVRSRRAIEAVKVRGSAPLLGLHGLTIDATGVAVYPRPESRVVAMERAGATENSGEHAPVAAKSSRASFDLPELDSLLEGGLTSQTATLVLGGPGIGKTLLSLYFGLAGVRTGDATVFLGFHETRHELLLKAAPFAIRAELEAALAPGGGVTFLRQPPVERDADVLADLLLNAVDRVGARRVIIDSIGELERAVLETSSDQRIPNYFASLLELLRHRGVTTLLLQETTSLASASVTLETDRVSLLAANVLWLQQITLRERLYRVLSVPKMRFSAHDTTLHEYTIATPDGLQVRASIESPRDSHVGISRQHL